MFSYPLLLNTSLNVYSRYTPSSTYDELWLSSGEHGFSNLRASISIMVSTRALGPRRLFYSLVVGYRSVIAINGNLQFDFNAIRSRRFCKERTHQSKSFGKMVQIWQFIEKACFSFKEYTFELIFLGVSRKPIFTGGSWTLKRLKAHRGNLFTRFR